MLALGSAWLPIVSLAAPEGHHSFKISMVLSLIGETCMLVAFALAPASVVVAVFSHSLVFTATLVRQIAQRHGGDVRCEPRPGGGSRFVLTLPG